MRNLLTTRTAKSARAKRSLTLLGALILLVLAGWAVAASAGPKVATPTITAGPSGSTSATAATFAFVAGARGDTLECSLDGVAYASCTSPKSYGGLANGAHTFRVRDRNPRLGAGDPATRTWTVDTIAPPRPTLTQTPPSPSASSSATFAFADSEAGVAFQCSLDNASFASCTSPKRYANLANGGHTFAVRALDAAGNRSASASYAWRVVASTTGVPFTISGGYGGLLYPGKTGDLSLRIVNPNGSAIYVTSLTVTIRPGSSNAGCDGPANLTVRQSNVSSTNLLAVPANGSVTLPSGAVGAPQVTMRNLPTNQDACQGAVYTFAYSGSAHS